eukprot:6190288-Pleurochrysis_carterae.AAC.3
MVAGDSTARDTFYTLMNVAGRPIMHGIMNDSRKYWGGYSPATPDRRGRLLLARVVVVGLRRKGPRTRTPSLRRPASEASENGAVPRSGL